MSRTALQTRCLNFMNLLMICSVHDRLARSFLRLQVPCQHNWRSLLRTDCVAPCGQCNSNGQCETCVSGYYASDPFTPVVNCCRPRPPLSPSLLLICSASHIVASQPSLVVYTMNCWLARLQWHVSVNNVAPEHVVVSAAHGICS